MVYGGATAGLMGAVADAALAGGAEVIGVLPDVLADKEIAHAGLTRLELVSTMHERKARMAKLADAFLILPGGYGTLDELNCMVRDAVVCHFEEDSRPKIIRLHFVRDEVIAV